MPRRKKLEDFDIRLFDLFVQAARGKPHTVVLPYSAAVNLRRDLHIMRKLLRDSIAKYAHLRGTLTVSEGIAISLVRNTDNPDEGILLFRPRQAYTALADSLGLMDPSTTDDPVTTSHQEHGPDLLHVQLPWDTDDSE